VATTGKRKPISAETRAEDERLREELRNADIGKFKQTLKRLMPAIARVGGGTRQKKSG
jgi:hypothetical protein